MKFIKTILILSLFFVFCFTPLQSSHSGMQPGFIYFHDTDNSSDSSSTRGTFVYFFDLRERETFIQLTYPEFVIVRGLTSLCSARYAWTIFRRTVSLCCVSL